MLLRHARIAKVTGPVASEKITWNSIRLVGYRNTWKIWFGMYDDERVMSLGLKFRVQGSGSSVQCSGVKVRG